ncbi:MAG: hypothetical protein QW154_07600 [Sulfolobales archaeon]
MFDISQPYPSDWFMIVQSPKVLSMGKRELAIGTEICHILIENEDADLYGVSKAKAQAKHLWGAREKAERVDE